MGELIYLFPERDRHRDGWNCDIDPMPLGDDKSALDEFLSQCRSKETRRNYKAEIERLFRWAAEIAEKSFRDLNARDYKRYGEFIANPPADWCGNRTLTRKESGKKPFNGPLSVSSQRFTFAAISSFLSFLVRYRYLKVFPMYKAAPIEPPNEVLLRENLDERLLSKQQLAALLRYTYGQLDHDGVRVRFFICIGLHLGLRIHEIADGVMGNFFESNGLWVYRVVGKGRKTAHVSVPKKLLRELTLYRQYMNMTDLPQRQDETPLFDVGVRRLSQLFKNAVLNASDTLPAGAMKEHMRKCSAHWLRHMYVKRLNRGNVLKSDVLKLGRHESQKTSDLYDDSMAADRDAAVRDLNFDEVLLVD